jgi:hypothetical protein
LGYEPEELVGKSGLKFIHPDDRKKLISLLGKYIQLKNKFNREARIRAKIADELVSR